MADKELSDLIYCPCGAGYKLDKTTDGYGIRGNLYICPTCKGVSYVDTNTLLGSTYVRFYPFTANLKDFKKLCLEYLSPRVNKHFFNQISDMKFKECFVPVREFDSGDNRFIIPLCDVSYTEGIIADKMNSSIYDTLFSEFDGGNLTSDSISIDNRPGWLAESFLPITVSDKMLQFEYNIPTQKFYVIHYWPIFIFSFSYEGERYYIKDFGTLPVDGLKSNFTERPRLTPEKYYAKLKAETETNVGRLKTTVVLSLIICFLLAINSYSKHGVLEGITAGVMGFIVAAIICGILSLIPLLPKFISKILSDAKSVVAYLKYIKYKKSYFEIKKEIIQQGIEAFNSFI